MDIAEDLSSLDVEGKCRYARACAFNIAQLEGTRPSAPVLLKGTGPGYLLTTASTSDMTVLMFPLTLIMKQERRLRSCEAQLDPVIHPLIPSLFFASNLFESSPNINNSVNEFVCLSLIRGGAERRRRRRQRNRWKGQSAE